MSHFRTLLLLPLAVVLALGAGLLGSGFRDIPGGQAQSAVIQLAAPPLREVAWTLTGDAALDPDTLALAVRLPAINGLTADEARDRFALTGTLAVGEASATDQTMTWTGGGPLTVYAHATPLPADAGAAAMREGQPVAGYDATITLSQITGDSGRPVYTGTMVLRQTAAYIYTYEGTDYRFGQLDLSLTVGITGGGTNTPVRLALFGPAQVSDRPATPLDSGPAPTASGTDTTGTPAAGTTPGEESPPATPAGTTGTTPDDVCATLPAWVADTQARLDAAAAQRAVILSGQELTAEDVDNALANVQTLLTEQQASAVPPGAEITASLAITTFSTDARALLLVQAAFAAGDQATLDQATALLTDAENLSVRALSTLPDLAASCGS